MRKSHVSQRQLAKGIGVSERQVSLWVNDKSKASIDSAIAIADYLGISMDELCGRDRKYEKSYLDHVYENITPEGQRSLINQAIMHSSAYQKRYDEDSGHKVV